MMYPSMIKIAWGVVLFISISAIPLPNARAQSLPVPTPGAQVATSSPGTVGMQGPGYAGSIGQPGLGVASQYGQGTVSPGSLSGQGIVSTGTVTGQGMGPVRLPNQNCGGMGQCAWAGQAQATAACTPDARTCTTTVLAPVPSTMTCSTGGATRTCTNAADGNYFPTPNNGTGSLGLGSDATGAGLLAPGINTGVPGYSGTTGPGSSSAGGILPTGISTGAAPTTSTATRPVAPAGTSNPPTGR